MFNFDVHNLSKGSTMAILTANGVSMLINFAPNGLRDHLQSSVLVHSIDEKSNTSFTLHQWNKPDDRK